MRTLHCSARMTSVGTHVALGAARLCGIVNAREHGNRCIFCISFIVISEVLVISVSGTKRSKLVKDNKKT